MERSYLGKNQMVEKISIGVVDRHRFDADPDPDATFSFYSDPDPTPNFINFGGTLKVKFSISYFTIFKNF
jgi:hypothetical protein